MITSAGTDVRTAFRDPGATPAGRERLAVRQSARSAAPGYHINFSAICTCRFGMLGFVLEIWPVWGRPSVVDGMANSG